MSAENLVSRKRKRVTCPSTEVCSLVQNTLVHLLLGKIKLETVEFPEYMSLVPSTLVPPGLEIRKETVSELDSAATSLIENVRCFVETSFPITFSG